ncbi:TetR/AcrR family transcriptional regulator [Nocardioides nematodiphilus]|uniref:TetR/AcrR family transcriptional regulator n=1 Tax=Nocardioides nematodiphilus TaxID=2849669 RepID=UPI001CD98EA6|nr:TetR/AcrR family transcriptional regulator [Nocardioides nematodiphilus]MCA1982717.1 TetR/AcrR family transcriptional regulator [Nocardioides nematodiphilus]
MTAGARSSVQATASKADGRQARWARHNEERRAQIVAAALELIGESEPGTEVHVQQIAERAGVNRTVVYRHFAERADLDIAIQQAIVAMLWGELIPSLTLEGTIPEIIDRIVGAYVGWAAEHRSLHYVVDRNNGTGVLEEAIDDLAGDIGQLVSFILVGLGSAVTLDVDELDALVHGVIGAVFGAVRRWLNRPNRVLSPDRLRAMMSQSTWFLIEGNARAMGVVLDPEQQIADLLDLTSAASGAEGPLATVAP